MGIRIQQRDVISAERHVSVGIVQFLWLSYAPYHIGHLVWALRASQGEQTEDRGTRQTWQEARIVSQGVETDQGTLRQQSLAEPWLGGDSRRRHDAANAPSGVDQEPRGLEEEHSRLQCLSSRVTVTTYVPQQMRRALCLCTHCTGLPRRFPEHH